MYSRLDKWLEQMSLTGWHVVHCSCYVFWFEKGEPMKKVYFTPVNYRNNGTKYNLERKYPFFDVAYGMDKKKSKINANITKTLPILEIDIQRIDIQRNEGYKKLVAGRNILSLQCFIRNILRTTIAAAAVIGLLVLWLHNG